ncbi:uncharacterized protein N7459_008452 [Penicillium hispanicum]|uniref:uncharacterized protein n=1 Tax=Penicillium hispanicum TaxID=1080232 RepID=UPI0025416E24|nr:uncharacterized protein N7459_008452 [Penicillium hispanicum]KAJ5574025.1 hypothetical protein N7459_008452 [Penicillium hispanicum]
MLFALILPLLLTALQSTAGSPLSDALAVPEGSENSIAVYDGPLEDDYEDDYEDDDDDDEDKIDENDSSSNSKREDTKLWSRDGTIIEEKTKRTEMKFISQSPGVYVNSLKKFVYQAAAGSGVTLYIHDSGLNREHPEFTGKLKRGVQRGTIRVIQPEKTESGETIPTIDGDPTGHGTCVVDKIIGQKLGIAKSANVVIFPWADFSDDHYNDDYMLAELQKMADTIKEDQESNPDSDALPIVVLSYSLGEIDSDTAAKYRAKYLALVDRGALLIAAGANSGNDAKGYYPGLFKEEDAFKDNMLVVGSVNIFGKLSMFSQSNPLVEIYAPGETITVGKKVEGIECAAKSGDGMVQQAGNSIATPQVAALAAYLHSVDSSLRGEGAVTKIIKKITDYSSGNGASWIRDRSTVPSIWNLEDGNVC